MLYIYIEYTYRILVAWMIPGNNYLWSSVIAKGKMLIMLIRCVEIAGSNHQSKPVDDFIGEEAGLLNHQKYH